MKLSNTLLTTGFLAAAGLASASPKALPDPSPLKHGSSYANSMGPVTFLYPETRQWSADVDNIAPCGSNAGVQNRSNFPLDDGFVAFIAKYQSFKIKLSISYNSDPKSQDDFDEWYYGKNVTDELHIGHTCFYMPDQPNTINSGDVATIQVIYQNDDEDETGSDGDPIAGSTNQTFYACSDIKFVEESVFDVTDLAYSCFNATNDNYYAESSIDADSSVATYDSSAISHVSSVARTASNAASATGSSSSASATGSSSSSSRAGAAIAAALSSPVAGFAGALAILASFIWCWLYIFCN